ncbi:MAG: 50S ribosomal protein L25/general stress protein Ctc [Corynebacterium sp.]|nr:50S ribosomal protein L25/general stress protein Ctc [Corynebacterium sp.]
MAHNAIAIEAAVRNEFGKGAARRARRAGLIPTVIYGHGMDPIHITVNRLEFQAILRNHGVNAVVSVDIEGEKQLAMIKTVDQNVLTFDIDHADLLAIKKGETVDVEVPVVHEGEPFSGTIVMQTAETVALAAEVMSIPEEIVVNVEGLEAGTQITAGDLKLPEGSTLVSEADTLVLHIVEPEEEPAEEDAAEGEESEEAPAEEAASEE